MSSLTDFIEGLKYKVNTCPKAFEEPWMWGSPPHPRILFHLHLLHFLSERLLLARSPLGKQPASRSAILSSWSTYCFIIVFHFSFCKGFQLILGKSWRMLPCSWKGITTMYSTAALKSYLLGKNTFNILQLFFSMALESAIFPVSKI